VSGGMGVDNLNTVSFNCSYSDDATMLNLDQNSFKSESVKGMNNPPTFYQRSLYCHCIIGNIYFLRNPRSTSNRKITVNGAERIDFFREKWVLYHKRPFLCDSGWTEGHVDEGGALWFSLFFGHVQFFVILH
jgi:hypothetical protein